MKINSFINRCLRAFIKPWARLEHQPRLAIEIPVIRIPALRQDVSRPVIRWRMNPTSGRLECRWTVAGASKVDGASQVDGADSSFFERFGAILADRAQARRGIWGA